MRGFGTLSLCVFAVSASLRLRKAAFDVSIHADAARFAVAAESENATEPRRGIIGHKDVWTGPGIGMIRINDNLRVRDKNQTRKISFKFV